MPWRFLDDLPAENQLVAGPASRVTTFAPRYLELKLADLELAIEDLESSADTPEEYETLRQLSDLRDRLTAVAEVHT